MLVCFVLGVSAQSLSKKISVSFKNTPLPTALKKIGKQSGMRVEFAYEDVKGYSVSAHLTAVNAESAVKAVIGNRPLTYKVVGDKFIIVSKGTSHHKTTPSNETQEVAQKYEEVANSRVQQMGKKVTGKVVDENHQPLPGVSVKCGNGRMGTYTDMNGEFTFTLPETPGQYLTFSYIGMQQQKVKLSSKTAKTLMIVMHDDASSLDEVVVTGYQVLDKRSLTSAVTSVKMDELNRADMSSVTYKRRPRYSDHSVDVMSSKERIQFSRELIESGYAYGSNETLVGYEKALQDLYEKNIDYNQFVNQVSAMEGYNTDWFDLICRDSWLQQHTASLSGGSNKSRYYASLGYNKDNDVIKVNSNERYTASMNLDNTFSKLLTASFNVSAYHYKRN